MDLNQKSKYINIVIGCKEFKYHDLNTIDKYCQQYYLHYAYIIHNKDKIITDGCVVKEKNTHLHLVGILKDTKRFLTILNQLRDYFGLSNLDAISIEKMLSIEGSIQYLIHKNDSDKYQYKVEEIHHNFGDDINTYLDMSSIELTFSKLREIIVQADSLLDVIQMLGIPRYNTYRNVVHDMWQHLKYQSATKVLDNEKKGKNIN